MRLLVENVGKLWLFIRHSLVVVWVSFRMTSEHSDGRSHVVAYVFAMATGKTPARDRAQSTPPPMPPPSHPVVRSPGRPAQRPHSLNLRGSLRLGAPGAPDNINDFAHEWSQSMGAPAPAGPYGGGASIPSTYGSEPSIEQIGRGTGVQTEAEEHIIHGSDSMRSSVISDSASLQDIARVVNDMIEHTNNKFDMFRKDMKSNDDAIAQLISGHHKLDVQQRTIVEATIEIADRVADLRAPFHYGSAERGSANSKNDTFADGRIQSQTSVQQQDVQPIRVDLTMVQQ